MKKQFTIHCVLIDTENNNSKDHLFVRVDTIANHADLYEISHSLMDPDTEDSDSKLKQLFKTVPDYHLKVKSDLLIRLVDQLGGIVIDGRTTDGKQTLLLFREKRLDDIVEAIGKALGGKNLLKTVPSLLSILSENYETDMPIMDIVKTILGEVNDLKDWKADLIQVNEENIASYRS
ncbi:MAG: hypothetical protein IJU42_08610 [Erysipelotrichaceae bacterium]|jgi:hypothetical protein|nr:hypothetical protein [Erysipelotrichaceae bacterium]